MSNVATIPSEGIKIERNGIELPFVLHEVKREGNLGKGTKYLAPDKTWMIKNFADFAKWIGENKLVTWAQGKLKQSCQESTIENQATDGTFDLEAFIADIANLSARGEKMSDLEDRERELLFEMTELASANLDADTLKAEFMKLSDEAREVRAAINSKKRERAAAKEGAPALAA